jgi:signal transduction histidine kinase
VYSMWPFPPENPKRGFAAKAEPPATDLSTVRGDSGGSLNGVEIICERHALFPRFGSLLAMSFLLRREWMGRLLIFNPRTSVDAGKDSAFLQSLISEISPAIYQVYALKSLRANIQKTERSRLAREIHDGTVQSLIGLRMLVDQAKKQDAGDPLRLIRELDVIREVLGKEIDDLRLKMLEIRPADIAPSRVVGRMAEMVQKFGRDFSISTKFLVSDQRVSLPADVCSELISILREALINIRKHASANHVVVRFDCQDGRWKLSVEDDGHGFEFAGPLSLERLDATGQGPAVIKERVRMIGGDLKLESSPGSWSRLEVSLPHTAIPHLA